MKPFKSSIPFLLFFLFISVSLAQNTINSFDFRSPPNSTKVNTWWHWISGNITKEGITKDLESMKQQGVSQATIINIGDQTTWFQPKTYVPVEIKFNSPEWYEMFQWALKEANRLDIRIGVHNCDGWSTSGGPWITPELSMKQYAWSKSIVDGGKVINTQLAQPAAKNNFYRDVAVVAYPIGEKQNSILKNKVNIEINKVSIGTKLTDGNPNSKITLNKGDMINFTFETDVEACKIALLRTVVFTWGNLDKVISQLVLSSSVDGKIYTKISELEFAGVNKINTVTFPTTKAKYFQLECKKGNYEVPELEILSVNETPAYSPQVSFLLEKTASLTPADERAFDLPVKNNKKGIAEKSVVDLSRYMSPEGVLNWKAPKGRWQIIRFGYTTTGVTNSPATSEGIGLEVDKMDTSALDIHFNSFAGKLLQSAGQYKGNTFKFLLIDSWECEFQNWTKKFPEEFKNRRGYDIIPWIPVLCGEFVGNPQLSDAFLHDFRKTISDLISQNYYKQFSDLCHRNKLEMHAEVIYGNRAMYPPLDVLKSNKYVDLPMIEFWADPNSIGIPEYQPTIRPIAYFPTYAALADKKQVIGSEAYTGYADYSDSPANLKPFGDAAFCSGINQMILHSYVHQPLDKKPGATLSGFGSTFNRNNPWWEFSQGWMTYQARVQYVLQKGEPVVDVLFYVGDQFPQFYSFNKSIANDLPFGFQANACNFDMLTEARVIDGKLSFGGQQTFPILTLPNLTIMDFVTLKRIAGLVKEGAVVLGPKPLEMISVQDIKTRTMEFNQLANSLWGNSGENQYGKGKVISGKSIGEVLKQLNVVPDLTTNSKDPKEIMFFHKKLGDTDAYFVFNQQARSLNRELIFRIAGKTPEIWNPENGSVAKPAIYSIEKNQTRIPVSFKPHESKIFVFKKGAPDQFIANVSLAGKQIFPQQQLGDTTFAIPQATFNKSKFGFTTNLSGEYAFTTNNNRILKADLVQTKISPIDNFKATIEFFPISDEVIQPVVITKLKSLTEFEDPAIRYFAGKAKYTITFKAPDSFISETDSVVLDLGNIDATAEVRLNGNLLAYAWMPNTELVVSGLLKNENKLEITVADVSRNRFIGDWIQFGKIKSIWSTSNALKKDLPLKPSGLMGPLKLVKYNIQAGYDKSKDVSQETMENIYNEVKTPFKYGVVFSHPDSTKLMDSPTIFRENNIWYMTYIIYDGQGYETWLAESENLLQWKTKGKILSFTEGTWDANQKAGYLSLVDFNWGGTYSVEKFQDRYWMSFIGGNSKGYETGILGIGIANSNTLTEEKEWNRMSKPVLYPKDDDARWFENKTIYKNLVVLDKNKLTGHPFVMYYNAKGDTANYESIGIAVSDDMVLWKRYGNNPVVTKHKGICGDAQIAKFNDLYIMFYFGAFWKPGAFERFACSYDLVNWTEWNGEDLVAPSMQYDKWCAHKPWVIKWNGIVYHFYTAVSEHGRVIALSTSKDLTK